MTLIPGYTITEIIEENSFLFCRARNKDEFPCIIKSTWLKNTEQARQLEHEYELVSNLDPLWVLKPISMERTSDSLSLIYTEFKGQLLSKLLHGGPVGLGQFLKIALNISKAILSIHDKGIIHKNIKPENILVNSETDELRIIDFSIASILPSEYFRPFLIPTLIEGTLANMSPEQTGRVNRSLDYRTDMYSLGVTFYQMLTGELPFIAKDALEWIYSHLVLIPRAPFAVSSKIPKVVSDIVMKLMEKLPEDRYQSIYGLIWDLTRCVDQLEKLQRVEPFALGEKDVTQRLNISQKIYGRENEIKLLLGTFQNVVQTGKSEFVLISGYSGIGKTALAKELYKPIVHERGFFISGKFEQLKRDIPYFTIVEAFRTLIINILSEPEDKLNTWKQNLIKALGVNGKIMTDVIPQLELIISKQPAVAKLPPSESRTRFNMVFEKFIQVFAKQEHPLTFFADDLQWADSASLKLINQIIINPDNHFILIIGAYRDNEVYPSHPLLVILNDLKKTQVNIKEIRLSPLKLEHIENLIADSIGCSPVHVKDLAKLIYNKTAGNPFFTIQFLIILNQEKLLRFDYKSGNWTWDTRKINAKEYTNNVVDLMVEKIKRLEIKSENLLKLAACIGNKFDIKTLSIIASETEDKVVVGLQPSLKEGLVFNFEHSIKFLHDRVQQAAYSLIPEEEKKEVHLKIARLLLHNIPKEEMEEEIFNIVTQFNRSNLNLLDTNEKLKVAELNLFAAKKAKASIAYESAKIFADTGIGLLSEQAWNEHYQLIFTLNIIKAECEYLTGDFKAAVEILDFLLTKAKSKTEKATVFAMKMRIYTSIGKMSEAVEIAIECLKMFNIYLSAHPSAEEISSEIEKTTKNIGDKKMEDFLNLPLMTNEEMKALVKVLEELQGPSFYTDFNLYLLHILNIINLSLQYGNTKASSQAYGLYGYVLASSGKYKEGYQYAKMAYDLVERHNFISYKGKIYLTLVLTSLWNIHVTKTIDFARKGFRSALEVGDLLSAGYLGGLFFPGVRLFKGDRLKDINQEIQDTIGFTQKYKLRELEFALKIQRDFIIRIQNEEGNLHREEILEMDIHKHEYPTKCSYYILKLQSDFIYKKYKEAEIEASKANEILWALKGTTWEPEFYYYYSLCLSANFASILEEEKNKRLEILYKNQERMKQWADNCPENFLDKYHLVSAEICRITGKIEEASQLYEASIKSAKINGFIHKEAICFELASEFYRERRFEVIADTYIKKAADLYSLWGASGKVTHLRKTYPFLKKQYLIGETPTFERMPLEQLDVLSIIKASQALSSEIVLEKLIKVLMEIVIEQAGAEKGFLLFERDDLLSIASEASLIDNEISIKTFDTVKLPEPDVIPQNLLQYVKRTQEKVILDDASLPNLFSSDNYLSTNKLKSIACLPIIKQTKLIGILYLENNLFTGAFSPDKILILELLASRAAISIENSILFTDLKNSQQLLQDTLDNSSAVIFAKQPNGRYLFVNLLFEKLFNVPKEKVVGMTNYEIFSKEFADQFSKNDNEVLQKRKSITYEEKVPLKDGIHSFIVVKFPLVDTEGKQYAVCGIATDITDKKQAEEIILQTNRELIKTTRDLDDFIYTASHDLKTPISNLEGLITMLHDREFNQEQERISILAMMNSSVEKFKKTIAALEKISEVQKNNSKDIRAVSFSHITGNVLYSLKEQIETSHAEIKTDFSDCKSILFSEKNLITILNNLISNAIKFRSPQRIPEIFIGTSKLENNFVLLTVRDNGLGISSDKKDKIFYMFKKMHGQTEGVGIGLYIVKRIVENTGGTIEVESTQGKGTEFKVRLKNILENKKIK